MEIKDIEILIECKRLVEKLLSEQKCILNYLNESGKGDKEGARCVQAKIFRMERALQGKPPVGFYDELGRLKIKER
jgi:hypothetical protein